MNCKVGPIFASDNLVNVKHKDKKPKGYSDGRVYKSRLQDALNVFETRNISDRIGLQNFWCSFMKQPKKSDVPVIEAYAILHLHVPELFNAKVWTYKDDIVKNIDPEHISFTQSQISQRMGQIPDFITQAKYDITPIAKWAVDVFPSI